MHTASPVDVFRRLLAEASQSGQITSIRDALKILDRPFDSAPNGSQNGNCVFTLGAHVLAYYIGLRPEILADSLVWFTVALDLPRTASDKAADLEDHLWPVSLKTEDTSFVYEHHKPALEGGWANFIQERKMFSVTHVMNRLKSNPLQCYVVSVSDTATNPLIAQLTEHHWYSIGKLAVLDSSDGSTVSLRAANESAPSDVDHLCSEGLNPDSAQSFLPWLEWMRDFGKRLRPTRAVEAYVGYELPPLLSTRLWAAFTSIGLETPNLVASFAAWGHILQDFAEEILRFVPSGFFHQTTTQRTDLVDASQRFNDQRQEYGKAIVAGSGSPNSGSPNPPFHSLELIVASASQLVAAEGSTDQAVKNAFAALSTTVEEFLARFPRDKDVRSLSGASMLDRLLKGTAIAKRDRFLSLFDLLHFAVSNGHPVEICRSPIDQDDLIRTLIDKNIVNESYSLFAPVNSQDPLLDLALLLQTIENLPYSKKHVITIDDNNVWYELRLECGEKVGASKDAKPKWPAVLSACLAEKQKPSGSFSVLAWSMYPWFVRRAEVGGSGDCYLAFREYTSPPSETSTKLPGLTVHYWPGKEYWAAALHAVAMWPRLS